MKITSALRELSETDTSYIVKPSSACSTDGGVESALPSSLASFTKNNVFVSAPRLYLTEAELKDELEMGT